MRVAPGGGGLEGSWGSGAPARGGPALPDDREMIKPTEKIDKGAKQLQLPQGGLGTNLILSWQRARSTGGLGQPG